jgi:hypothetical protein
MHDRDLPGVEDHDAHVERCAEALNTSPEDLFLIIYQDEAVAARAFGAWQHQRWLFPKVREYLVSQSY